MPNEIKTKTFRGVVNPDTRVLKIINKDKFDKFLESLEGEIEIVVSEVHSRTHWQNNYYWNAVRIIAEELGYTDNEMHATIKNHFEVESTKTLSTKEFASFIERLVRWSAIELNIVIPDP